MIQAKAIDVCLTTSNSKIDDHYELKCCYDSEDGLLIKAIEFDQYGHNGTILQIGVTAKELLIFAKQIIQLVEDVVANDEPTS